MSLAAFATPLALLALALPFLFGHTQPPITNFWPLLVSWLCGVVLLALGLARRQETPWGQAPGCRPPVPATLFAAGLALAALAAAVVGLLQYFWGDPGLPGVQPSTLGQAMGNLRQRNQQATLLSLGVWALLWSLAQRRGRPPRNAALPALPALSAPVAKTLYRGGAVMAVALLAVSSAATASRTGALQWVLVAALLCLWRASCGGRVLRLAAVAVAVYVLAAWGLPLLLLHWTGTTTDGLFVRFLDGNQACASRSVLWSNVLYLIAQKPWLGWGWGELDYAHYITLFPGPRFCVLLDNAHNLPLHLAVELGVPAALALCGGVAAWIWRERPWREADPARQLAWGVLALIGLHSLVEFPLWYGPFQLTALLAVALLWRWPLPHWTDSRAAKGAFGAALAVLALLGAYAAWDFYRVGQLYRPLAERPASLRQDTVRKVGNTPFFTDQVDFALLTTLALTRDNAGQAHAVATKLLHYSPEPRVIEPLIESAVMLGLDDEAAFHLRRYRAAYPVEYERWRAAGASQPVPRPEP